MIGAKARGVPVELQSLGRASHLPVAPRCHSEGAPASEESLSRTCTPMRVAYWKAEKHGKGFLASLGTTVTEPRVGGPPLSLTTRRGWVSGIRHAEPVEACSRMPRLVTFTDHAAPGRMLRQAQHDERARRRLSLTHPLAVARDRGCNLSLSYPHRSNRLLTDMSRWTRWMASARSRALDDEGKPMKNWWVFLYY